MHENAPESSLPSGSEAEENQNLSAESPQVNPGQPEEGLDIKGGMPLIFAGCGSFFVFISIFIFLPGLIARMNPPKPVTGLANISVQVDPGCSLKAVTRDRERIILGKSNRFSAPAGKPVLFEVVVNEEKIGKTIALPAEDVVMLVGCKPARFTFNEPNSK